MATDTLVIVCVIIVIISCLFCCGDFYAVIKGPNSKRSETCCSRIGFIALVIWTISALTMSIYSQYRDINDLCEFDPNEKCVQTHSKGSYTKYGKDCSSECRALIWTYGIGYTAGGLGLITIIFTIIGLTAYGNSFSEYGIAQMLKEDTNRNKRQQDQNRNANKYKRKRKDKPRRRYSNDRSDQEDDEYNIKVIAYGNKNNEINRKQLEIEMKPKPAPIKSKPKPKPKPREPTPPPLPNVNEVEQKRCFEAYKMQLINGLMITSFVSTNDSNKIELFPVTTVDIIISYMDFTKTSRLTFFGAGFNRFGGLGIPKGNRKGKMRTALKAMKELEYRLPSNDSNEYVVDFYVGSSYTVLESNLGYFYGVGFNSNGQLGFKSYQKRRAHERSPKRITHFDKIIVKNVFVNCTSKATFVSDYTLKIYGFGFNKNANLGLGIDAEFITYPQHVEFFDNMHIIDIQNDFYGSVALDTRGNIYITASPYQRFPKSKWVKAELMSYKIRRARKREGNMATSQPKIIQICIGGQIQFPHFLDIEGTVYRGCFNGFALSPVPYYKQNGIKIVQLMGGTSYNIALCEEGNIYQWNDLLDGKIRNQPFHDPVRNEFFVDKHVIDVKCGQDHCCVICTDDNSDEKEYYMFGSNSHNSITTDNATQITEPMLFNFKQKCGLQQDDMFDVHLGSCTTMVVVQQQETM